MCSKGLTPLNQVCQRANQVDDPGLMAGSDFVFIRVPENWEFLQFNGTIHIELYCFELYMFEIQIALDL